MEEYFDNNIIKAKRGAIYKGHAVSAQSTNSAIQIHNTYWDVTVTEQYNANENQTETLVHWVKQNPKWLEKLVDKINIFNFKTYFNNEMERNGNKLEVSVNTTYSMYTVKYISPGIAFKNPTDNISQIKNFKKIFSAFHKKMKKADADINNYKLIGSDHTLSERFFNEFDIALATEIKGLPF